MTITRRLLSLFTKPNGPTLPEGWSIEYPCSEDEAHVCIDHDDGMEDDMPMIFYKASDTYELPQGVIAALAWRVEDRLWSEGEVNLEVSYDEDLQREQYRIRTAWDKPRQWIPWSNTRLEALVAAAERALENNE